jgi:hypothetical protein
VKLSGAGGSLQTFTLTAAWKQYTYSVSSIEYNTPASGLEYPIVWRVDPAAPLPSQTEFWLDDIQYEM